jgi:hypothetical protein
MSRRVAVALGASALIVAAAVAVPLLAPGGDQKPRLTKAAYSRSVTAIFAEVGRRFRASPGGPGLRETSAGLSSIKEALDEAVAKLHGLDPPADAERLHRTLVSATHSYAVQVDLVRASVDFGDPATIATHLREVTAPRAIQRVIRSLNASGYRIPVTIVVLH